GPHYITGGPKGPHYITGGPKGPHYITGGPKGPHYIRGSAGLQACPRSEVLRAFSPARGPSPEPRPPRPRARVPGPEKRVESPAPGGVGMRITRYRSLMLWVSFVGA